MNRRRTHVWIARSTASLRFRPDHQAGDWHMTVSLDEGSNDLVFRVDGTE